MRRPTVNRVVRALALGLLVAVAAACVPPSGDQPVDPAPTTPDPGSHLIGCDQASVRVTVTVSSHLDPACTYTGGFDVAASNVVFDCRGAHVEDPEGDGRIGILITTPATAPLSNVTVRNCFVEGFLNNVRVTRDGFKTLAAGAEYDTPTANILIENSHLYASQGVGAYVDGYVTGVTLRDLQIQRSGSTGVYLEAGSKDNVVEDSTIAANGFKDLGPDGATFTVGGTVVHYTSTGREGIAVDGSRNNLIRRNWIAGNAAGGVFLYKNCGEFATQQPAQHWTRRYGADGNLIEGNTITSEPTGVWVGSRAAENQYFLDCSDPAYVTGAATRIFLDPAADNVVRGNAFGFVNYGIRVEDDGTHVEQNTFADGLSASSQAVIVGTEYRTSVLGRPVTGTVIRGNRASLTSTDRPYRWIWGQNAGTYADNLVGGVAVPLTAGTQPPINPFLFVVSVP